MSSRNTLRFFARLLVFAIGYLLLEPRRVARCCFSRTITQGRPDLDLDDPAELVASRVARSLEPVARQIALAQARDGQTPLQRFRRLNRDLRVSPLALDGPTGDNDGASVLIAAVVPPGSRRWTDGASNMGPGVAKDMTKG
jgi:hypothetical protein